MIGRYFTFSKAVRPYDKIGPYIGLALHIMFVMY